jgi:hypothetical protein
MLKLLVCLITIVFLAVAAGTAVVELRSPCLVGEVASLATGADARFPYFCLFLPGDAEALLLGFSLVGLPFLSEELDVAKDVSLVAIGSFFSFDLPVFLTFFSGIQSKKFEVLIVDMCKVSDARGS